jgi:SAM-dependent methyltransferase
MTTDSRARTAYETWHRQVESPEADANRPWHDLLFRYIEARDMAGTRVLEIGCGRGELACRVMREPVTPRQYVAADFAQSALLLGRRRARRDGLGGIQWAAADMQHLPLGDATFDAVISCETIEHLPDPVQALREVHRVLAPGGRLFLTTPNYLGPFGLYRVYLRLRGRRYTEGDQPICRFTLLPRTLLWLRRAGFRPVTVDASGHYLLFPRRVPFEPRLLKSLGPWLWPIGLHSIVVAEKC